MQQNLLRSSDVVKIYLVYADNGSRKREVVKFRFMDKKECYLSAPCPSRFVKPKKKIPAEIRVFTQDGIYKTNITLLDTTVSMRDVMYEVSVPKSWDFVQLRASTRKQVGLPVVIQFNDGFKIEATTYDLSLGGVSFFLKNELPSIYTKVSGILSLKLPKETLINFPDGKMTVESKFVRTKENPEGFFDEHLYIYKFINITQNDTEILKTFLIKLN